MVEDLATNYWISGEFHEGPGNPATFIERAKKYVDAMHVDNARNFSHPELAGKSVSFAQGTPLLPPSTELEKTIVGVHFYNNVVVLQKGVFRSREVIAGKQGVRHDKQLEHRRPSADQVKQAREAAAKALAMTKNAGTLPAQRKTDGLNKAPATEPKSWSLFG